MIPDYIRWDGRESPPSLGGTGHPSKVMIIAELSLAPEQRALLASKLVAEGACYVCAWGVDCDAYDDDVDLASVISNLDAVSEAGADRYVMTTWHSDQTLEEAMHFFKHDAIHPDVQLTKELLLHIAERDDEARLQRLFEVCQI